MTIEKKLEDDFVKEAKAIVKDSLEVLERIEGDFSQVQSLAEFGNLIDRIMGAARSLVLMGEGGDAVVVVGDYAEVCKFVAYKASALQGNSQLFDVSVALLLDAVETLSHILDHMHETQEQLKVHFTDAFIERLRWVSQQFSAEASVGSVKAEGTMNQSDIDQLLAKLGF